MSPLVRPLYTEKKGYIKCINTFTICIGSEHTILLRDRRQYPPSTGRKIDQPDNLISKCITHFKVSQFVQHAPRMSYQLVAWTSVLGVPPPCHALQPLYHHPPPPHNKKWGGGDATANIMRHFIDARISLRDKNSMLIPRDYLLLSC
jgi:hypothetical protein